jgi:hypothetical protein
MFEEILKNALIENKKEYILRIANIILWISIIFVSYNMFVGRLDLIPLSDVHAIYTFLVNGSYIQFIEWLFVIVVLYYIIKLILFRYLLNNKYLMDLFYVITPSKIKIPLQAILYKKNHAKDSYKKRVRKYLSQISVQKNKDFLELSESLMGILLKIIILGILKLKQSESSYLSVFAIVFTFLIILIIEFAVIKARGENKFCDFIKKLNY